MFHQLSKQLEFRQKYSARRIFNSLLGVWISDETLFLVFDILLKNAHVAKDDRKKLDVKSRKCILLGYGTETKGYRLYGLI